MAERCGLRSLPKDTLENGINGFVWEPYIPTACMLYLRKALNSVSVKRELVHDSTQAAEVELRDMSLDPESVDMDYGIGVKLAEGSLRRGVEESGIDLFGYQGGWTTYAEEFDFKCANEGV